MDLDTMMITAFCRIDDALQDLVRRARPPISDGSRNRSGRCSWMPSRMARPWRWWTVSPCPSAGSPGPTAASGSAGKPAQLGDVSKIVPRCQQFRGEAAYGWDSVARPAFYGFRIHLRRRWPGLIADFNVAPANVGVEVPPGPDLAGRLQVATEGPGLVPTELPTQPAALPHRNRVQPAGGAVSNQAGSGQGQLASARDCCARCSVIR